MLAAWARDTDGNLIPLCRRTDFSPTFEVSVNKGQSVGICRYPRPSITEQT